MYPVYSSAKTFQYTEFPPPRIDTFPKNFEVDNVPKSATPPTGGGATAMGLDVSSMLKQVKPTTWSENDEISPLLFKLADSLIGTFPELFTELYPEFNRENGVNQAAQLIKESSVHHPLATNIEKFTNSKEVLTLLLEYFIIERIATCIMYSDEISMAISTAKLSEDKIFELIQRKVQDFPCMLSDYPEVLEKLVSKKKIKEIVCDLLKNNNSRCIANLAGYVKCGYCTKEKANEFVKVIIKKEPRKIITHADMLYNKGFLTESLIEELVRSLKEQSILSDYTDVFSNSGFYYLFIKAFILD